MTTKLPNAVVFDCDGTIADTERVSRQAWELVLDRYGYLPGDDDYQAIVGRPWALSYGHFAAKLDLPPSEVFREERRQVFLEHLDTDLRIFEDARRTLVALSDAGVPVAVTSSSSRAHVDRILDRAGLSDRVRVRLGADDVTDHKPHPEPYLAAARGLGVAASACTAVEDTPTGVASAVAAGMFTVAVRRDMPVGDLDAADRIVDEITLDVLVP